MFKSLIKKISTQFEPEVVYAHCDGPCGVYDPASARVAAEAVLSMSKKMAALEAPTEGGEQANYLNSMARYASIKEEQAELAKHELLVLWTDYFKPDHLEAFPNLHETFWKAAKLCSATKQHVDVVKAEELMKAVEEIHHMFWKSKGKDVAWTTAS